MEVIYHKKVENFVVIFRLPEEMRAYVQVICKQIKRDISRDLTELYHSWEPGEDTIKNIMFTAVKEIGGGSSED